VRLSGQGKHLTINARVTLDTGSAQNTERYDGVIKELITYLKNKYAIGKVSVTAPKPADKVGTRPQDMSEAFHQRHNDALVLAGRVRSGQTVTAKGHLVILGDVNPGAEVVAGSDIIVIGSLGGKAIAGQPDNEKSIVLALDFRPTQIQIGRFMAAGLPPSVEKMPEFAHVENGAIVVDDYIQSNPFGRLPWPEVR